MLNTSISMAIHYFSQLTLLHDYHFVIVSYQYKPACHPKFPYILQIALYLITFNLVHLSLYCQVDMLLQQFNSGGEIKANPLRWHEVCQNIPYAVYEVLIAWECGVLTADQVKVRPPLSKKSFPMIRVSKKTASREVGIFFGFLISFSIN